MTTSPADTAPSRYLPGTLVHARHRDWVVLPPEPSDPPGDKVLRLRPLAGGEHERIALMPALEQVVPATFLFPNPERQLGNHQAARLLREATRLATRAAAGPFLSLARIGVEPRPYQFVPLMMALQQEPVRLLIADDVGVGKTIEACLIARELWDRGDIKSMTVLCPPALADQWVRALTEMFHLETTLVLPSTAQRLEREAGDNLFRRYPITVVSLDYIKSDRRRDIFLRDCPDLVLVDEAHTCANTGSGNSQKRYQLLEKLVSPAHNGTKRNLLLVTATPHTGNQDAFRSLLALLDPSLVELPPALLEPESAQQRTDEEQEAERMERWRARLAVHFVQRRRADLERYLRRAEGQRSPFPGRRVADVSADMHADMRAFFMQILALCRRATGAPQTNARELHLRYWSALALLRAVSSSPEAAAATLLARAGFDSIEQVEELDSAAAVALHDAEDQDQRDAEVGLSSVLNISQRELVTLAEQARALRGPVTDLKLHAVINEVRALVKAGRHPILFCRFISTVGYIAQELREALKDIKELDVVEITGALPHEERRDRIDAMDATRPRVLVCTDCLSEGINLQHHFNAVIHYDLAWTPTRHEQREGRVDRYEQPSEEVFLLTLHVSENPVDRYVLTVLEDRRRTISSTTGVQIGEDTSFEAIQRSLIALFDQSKSFEEQAGKQTTGTLFKYSALKDKDWKPATVRLSRELFAQGALQRNVEERLPELLEMSRRAMGSPEDALDFLKRALPQLGAVLPTSEEGATTFDLSGAPAVLRDMLVPRGWKPRFRISAGFVEGAHRIVRTHPLVAQTAAYVLEAALDPDHDPSLPNPAARCAVIRTAGVERLTNLLIIRARYRIAFVAHQTGARQETIVDDIVPICFKGKLDVSRDVELAAGDEAERLLGLEPSANLDDDVIRRNLDAFVDPDNRLHLDRALAAWITQVRVRELEEQYRRVFEIRVRTTEGLRQLARRIEIEPLDQFDHLAISVFLPA